jgi:hypothetical protein
MCTTLTKVTLLKWTTTCESKYENFPKPSSRKLEPVNWVYEEEEEKRDN